MDGSAIDGEARFAIEGVEVAVETRAKQLENWAKRFRGKELERITQRVWMELMGLSPKFQLALRIPPCRDFLPTASE